MRREVSVAGLFSGIGGLELGFRHHERYRTRLMCEIWGPAQTVLAARFPKVRVVPDVRALADLGGANVVTAGFPCTDLSQAGRTAGIHGPESGLVSQVFRLVDEHPPHWLVLENVRNMLPLDGGRAMRYLVDQLELRGFRWAYRVIDSRFVGVPQRRNRVLLVASRRGDPRAVLLGRDAGPPDASTLRDDCYGFYWTEGLRGLGWVRDGVPPLKGGSTIGIPSPPAVWRPSAPVGSKFVLPGIEDAEAMQGFERGWTAPAEAFGRNVRWKLVGNAVTVGVAQWLADQIEDPGSYDASGDAVLEPGARWPAAAHGGSGRAWIADVSAWPERQPYTHLSDLLDAPSAKTLSYKASAGFLSRASRAKLRFDERFILDLEEHAEYARDAARVA